MERVQARLFEGNRSERLFECLAGEACPGAKAREVAISLRVWYGLLGPRLDKRGLERDQQRWSDGEGTSLDLEENNALHEHPKGSCDQGQRMRMQCGVCQETKLDRVRACCNNGRAALVPAATA